LWSVVFPLGMYSVATLSYGKTARIGFMVPLGRFMLWVAVASCVLVAAAFVARLARSGRGSRAPGLGAGGIVGSGRQSGPHEAEEAR
jgi:tellurite resistance protein TehA-like permease